MASNLDDIVEFDKNLNKITGIEALKMRLEYKLRMHKREIPFYSGGTTDTTFSFSDDVTLQELKRILKEMGLESKVSITNGRYSLVDIGIILDNI